MKFNFLIFMDPEFGIYKKCQDENINEIAMTTTLDYIIDTIGLPPHGSSLIWRENKDGLFTPAVRYEISKFKLNSINWDELMKYKDLTGKLEQDQLIGEIHYAITDSLTIKSNQHVQTILQRF